MTPPPKRQDDWAEKQAMELIRKYEGEPATTWLCLHVDIAQALRQARLSALDEAAKVAEATHEACGECAFSIEQAIRALADGGGKDS